MRGAIIISRSICGVAEFFRYIPRVCINARICHGVMCKVICVVMVKEYCSVVQNITFTDYWRSTRGLYLARLWPRFLTQESMLHRFVSWLFECCKIVSHFISDCMKAIYVCVKLHHIDLYNICIHDNIQMCYNVRVHFPTIIDRIYFLTIVECFFVLNIIWILSRKKNYSDSYDCWVRIFLHDNHVRLFPAELSV